MDARTVQCSQSKDRGHKDSQAMKELHSDQCRESFDETQCSFMMQTLNHHQHVWPGNPSNHQVIPRSSELPRTQNLGCPQKLRTPRVSPRTQLCSLQQHLTPSLCIELPTSKSPYTARDPLHKIKIVATFKFPCPHLFQGGSHSPQTSKQMLQGTVPHVSSQCHSCRCSTNLDIQSMAAPCPLLPPLCRSR